MKKNDKIIAIIGVIILLIASIGIFTWTPIKKEGEILSREEVNWNKIPTGEFEKKLESASVSDSDPFYPLILTPLAVNYDKAGNQRVVPLYVENFTDPSESIEKLQDKQLDKYQVTKFSKSKTPKELSLDIAEEYWEKSNAALIIENNKDGYSLGVNAVPIASYLSIPVIVTDSLDQDVKNVLSKLQTEKVIICGENIEASEHYQYIKFDTVEQIVDSTVKLVEEKFGEVGYITLANPVDAYPPKVIDKKNYYFGPTAVTSKTMNDGMGKFSTDLLLSETVSWKFEIPKNYKYTLIEVEVFNHNIEGVEKFGDRVSFEINPVHDAPMLGDGSTAYNKPVRDGKGNLIKDRAYTERVMYDCGGKSYTITPDGKWAADEEGKVSAKVTVKKLENPVYSMVKKHSTLAPYLTSYRKGIVFAKSDFAFTADDHVVTNNGETCPGFYLPGRNADLVPMSNKHIFDKIHKPLNEL
ncbi:MAG: hypothetical protein V5A68_04115, partial [Candidatus Thermoplasmatota archaeon]